MEITEIIQGEYRLFKQGKLLFEIIYPDAYEHLRMLGLLNPAPVIMEAAVVAINNYRQVVLRQRVGEQLDPVKALHLPAPEVHREAEDRYRKILVKKLLVYQWYAEQLEKGAEEVLKTNYLCSL